VVVIRALLLHFAMITPLKRPTMPPAATPASTPRATLPVRSMTTAASTPEHATTEPTDRSKSPEARQNSMVQATMPMVETDSASPFMFAQERKSSTHTAQPPNRRAKTTSIPAASHRLWRAEWLGALSEVS